MATTEYVHKISQTDLLELLGITERDQRKLERRGLPATTTPPEGKAGRGGRSLRFEPGSTLRTYDPRVR